jgi:hypothetical protein
MFAWILLEYLGCINMLTMVNLTHFVSYFFVQQKLSCRWDESVVSLLPEYLRKFYIELLRTFKNIDSEMPVDINYDIAYLKKAVITKKILNRKNNLEALTKKAIFVLTCLVTSNLWSCNHSFGIVINEGNN